MADPSRAATSRQSTERQTVERRFDPGGRGILHIEPGDVPSDFRLLWVREYTLGRHDPDNITRALDDGYEPVPASEMPSYVPPSLEEGRPEPKFIRRGGQILMRKPIKLAEEDRKAMEEYNRRILTDIDRDRSDSSHPHIPALRPELERKIERSQRSRFEDDR